MNKILSLILVVFLFSLMVVSATPAKTCTEYGDVGNDPFTPGYIVWTTGSSHTEYDECDGQSDNMKEFYCNGTEKAMDNVHCVNGCVIVSGGPDYCAGQPQVPEFSGIAAGLALTGAAAGFIFLKRKK